MIAYFPIATYHDTEDILKLFPTDFPMTEDADTIVGLYFLDWGNPHKLEGYDDEAIWTEAEVEEDENFILTKDGKYGVRLTYGDIGTFKKYGNDQAGYYIDIYQRDENAPRYMVWADSDSTVDIDYTYFEDLEDAHAFASEFVHRYDGEDADRVILHIDDRLTDETIDTCENINKCDGLAR